MSKTQTQRLFVCICLFGVLTTAGCHRSYYRRQADADANRLVTEKSQDPRWNSSDGSIIVDPQSRMFDPFSQDHPPMPPDDASSAELMRMVDGKPGYPHWHANGDTNYVASPEWLGYLPKDEQGRVVINFQSAYELALIHSTDLQRQKETLYLSALDVSLERFGFDTQMFSGFDSFFRTQGRLRTGASTSQGSFTPTTRFEKLGITGSTFVVGLANSILWNFAGPNTRSATTLIDFSLIQPLLRGAGRERVMESLTQAERTLLANVRQMDRFYRGFYLNITTGRNAGAGPGSGFLSNPGGFSTNAGGFMGLVQQQQEIRIIENNIRQLEPVLDQFREFYERERIDSQQVRRVETDLLSAQQQLLRARTSYQDSLDRFKITLGLPPDLELVIDDPFLDKFEFISDGITEQQISLKKLRDETGGALIELGEFLPEDTELVRNPETGLKELPPNWQWKDGLDDKVEALKPYFEQVDFLVDLVRSRDIKELLEDFDKLDQIRPERIEYLQKLQTAIEGGAMLGGIENQILDPNSMANSQNQTDPRTGDPVPGLRELLDRTLKKLDTFEIEIDKIKQQVEGFRQARPQIQDQNLYDFLTDRFMRELPKQLSDFSNVVLEMSLLQAQARANTISIPEIDISSEAAIKIARCLRRDWMNARAELVDRWRQIEFTANSLEAGVDLVFEGDIANQGDSNPFKLRYETGQLRAGLRFDAPLVRLAERNTYRRALINYQQARRQYYQFEDSIKQNLRSSLRAVDLNKILFEVNRRSIQIAIERVEQARFALDEPTRGTQRTTLGATAALNLTDAIAALQNSQNSFLSTWVSYEVLRRGLDFDLGTMQIDENGYWTDPGKIDATIGVRSALMMGVELDCRFCDGLDAEINELPDSAPGDFMPQPQTTPPTPTGAEPTTAIQFQKNRATGKSESKAPKQEPLYPFRKLRESRKKGNLFGANSAPARHVVRDPSTPRLTKMLNPMGQTGPAHTQAVVAESKTKAQASERSVIQLVSAIMPIPDGASSLQPLTDNLTEKPAILLNTPTADQDCEQQPNLLWGPVALMTPSHPATSSCSLPGLNQPWSLRAAN